MVDKTISDLEKSDEVLEDMLIAVDAASATKSISLRQVRAYLGSSLPTGFLIHAIGRIKDERFSLLDGKVLSSTGTYEGFYNKVVEMVQSGDWVAVSEAQYSADMAQFGQCGAFVVGVDYLKLPTITRFVGASATLSEISKTYKDQMQNIKGKIGIGGTETGTIGAEGALYQDGSITNSIAGSYTGNRSLPIIAMDASRSARTGSETYPTHTRYPYYIVVSTVGQTENITVDINKVYEDMNLRANLDLSNLTSISGSGRQKILDIFEVDYTAITTITVEPFIPPTGGEIRGYQNYGNDGGWIATTSGTTLGNKAPGSYGGNGFNTNFAAVKGKEYKFGFNGAVTWRFYPYKGAI